MLSRVSSAVWCVWHWLVTTISARTIHHSFTELFSLLFIDGNPAGAKSMLNAMGFIENKLRLPLVPTRITTFEKIRDVLRQLSIKC